MKIETVTCANPIDGWTIMVRALYDRPIKIGPVHIEEDVIKIVYCGSSTHVIEFDVKLKDNWPIVITSEHSVIVNGKSVSGRLIQGGQNLDCTRSALRVSEYDRISHLYVWDECANRSQAIILRTMADKIMKDHLVYRKAPEVKVIKEDIEKRMLYEQAGF